MDSCRVLHVAGGGSSLAPAADALEGEGFAVATATSVSDAKDLLETEGFDCVLSELHLDDGDAFELLGWVRAQDPSLPFVMLSPETADAVVERAIDAGVTEFVSNLVPSVSPQLLAMRLRNAVRATDDSETETDTPRSDPLFQTIKRALNDDRPRTSPEQTNGNGHSTQSLVEIVRGALGETASDAPPGELATEDQLVWYSLGSRTSTDEAGSDDSIADAEPATPNSESGIAATPTADAGMQGMDQLLAAVGRAHSDGGTDTRRVDGRTGHAPMSPTTPRETDQRAGNELPPVDSAASQTDEVDDATAETAVSMAEDPTTSPDDSSDGDSADDQTTVTREPDLSELSDEELLAFATGPEDDDTPEAVSASATAAVVSDEQAPSATESAGVDSAPATDTKTARPDDWGVEADSNEGREVAGARPSLEQPPETTSGTTATTPEPPSAQESAAPEPDEDQLESVSQVLDTATEPQDPDAASASESDDTSAGDSPFDATDADIEATAGTADEEPPAEMGAQPDTTEPEMAEEFEPAATGLEDLSPPDADAAAPSEDETAPGSFGDFGATSEYERPEQLDLSPGTSVLVQCGSQDDRREAACVDLLDPESIGGKQVLLIRYRRMDEARLERIATSAERVKFISIGYTQPLPPSIEDAVSTVKINNPNDLTRLGIIVTATVDNWESNEAGIVACVDPLDAVMQYKGVESLFRFLHLFLGKLQNTGVVSHFHVDPSAGDPQKINVFKPLFDAVLTIDSVGTHLESG